MSKSFNQVTLVGRMTADPEVRTTPSGKNVVSFSLAVDRMSKDDGADFIEVTAWEKLADIISQYTQKGSKLLVNGRLRQDTWDDKETGKKRSKLNVVANDVMFLDSKQPDNPRDTVLEDIEDKPVSLSDIPF